MPTRSLGSQTELVLSVRQPLWYVVVLFKRGRVAVPPQQGAVSVSVTAALPGSGCMRACRERA